MIERSSLRRERSRLAETHGEGAENALWASAAMRRVRDLLEQIAETDVTVLIHGESGTGKEVVARALHVRSSRSQQPFVKVNCAALPADLLESELFGYEKGAFTGAGARKQGKFEQANRGAIFLDEIGEMSPPLQAKLLQVLQDNQFSRLGGNVDIRVDVRIVCATNRRLEEMVREGTFREDLFFRLNVVNVALPPLRERREEIPALVESFVRRFALRYARPVPRLSEGLLELFQRYRPDEVVMWCPSCIYYYDEIVHADLPFRVRHTTEFLLDHLARFRFTAPVNATVAVHAHAVGDARVREARACRALLAGVPGVRVVDLESEPRFGRSCAPAIPQALGQDVWDGLVRDEIERARAAGADTLACIYHGCQRMICGFEADGRLTIEHYLSVFARALGIEFEDTFKKYRLWADPERVLQDATPCMEANHVDPTAARTLVTTTFGRRPTPGSTAAPS